MPNRELALATRRAAARQSRGRCLYALLLGEIAPAAAEDVARDGGALGPGDEDEAGPGAAAAVGDELGAAAAGAGAGAAAVVAPRRRVDDVLPVPSHPGYDSPDPREMKTCTAAQSASARAASAWPAVPPLRPGTSCRGRGAAAAATGAVLAVAGSKDAARRAWRRMLAVGALRRRYGYGWMENWLGYGLHISNWGRT